MKGRRGWRGWSGVGAGHKGAARMEQVKGRTRPVGTTWVEGEEGAVGALRAKGRSLPGAARAKARSQAAGQRGTREGAARPKGNDAARGRG